MTIETIVVGAFEVNCFLLWGTDRRALVVDPGSDAETIDRHLTDNRLTVAAYALTHGHVDHISGLADLHRRHPAPIGLHPLDAAWAFSEANAMPPWYGVPARPVSIARAFEDGQTWTDAELTYTIFATPGHTPGGVCLYFETARVLLSGDTLFAGSVGRTDLPGGNARILTASLKRLAALPDDVRIYPGHGAHTTLAHEKRTNFFMQSA
jgi:hydroxyacylglutathione hydrolase